MIICWQLNLAKRILIEEVLSCCSCKKLLDSSSSFNPTYFHLKIYIHLLKQILMCSLDLSLLVARVDL
jgi:hypothetical protein